MFVVFLSCLLTIVFSFLIAFGSSVLNGFLFFLGFCVATGVGGMLRRSIREGFTIPFRLAIMSLIFLFLSFWLGSFGQISLSFSHFSQTIYGEWWCVIGGTLAGLLLRDQPTLGR